MVTAPEPDGIVWQKSSYSAANGGCVEVGWRTSSYCGTDGDCVQVAPALDRVLVRDSKDPEGTALAVPPPRGEPSCTPSPPDRLAGLRDARLPAPAGQVAGASGVMMTVAP